MKKVTTYYDKNHTALSIPDEFKVDVGEQFFIFKDEFGAIVMIPEKEFRNPEKDDLIKNFTTRELN